MSYKILKVYKTNAVYLIEDQLGRRFILKKNAPQLPVIFFKLLKNRKDPLLEYVPSHMFNEEEGRSYLRKYIDGEIAGNSTYLFGFSDRAFECLVPAKVVEIILNIQKIPASPDVFGDLEIRHPDWYLERLCEPRDALESVVGLGTYEKVKKKMREVKSIMGKQTNCLANGDLHPKNILLFDSKFIILDWDLLHINNPGYDLSFLYLWGWRNKKWREAVLREYAKVNPDYEPSFSYCVAYLSAQLIKHAEIILDNFIMESEFKRKKLAEKFQVAMIEELLGIC